MINKAKSYDEFINESNQNGRFDYGDRIVYYKNGKKHRDGGPAVIYPNGDEMWFQNGILYRKGDGASSISKDSKGGITKSWHNKKGQLSRTDGAAIEWSNGREQYALNGKLMSKDVWEKAVKKLKK